MKRDDTLVQALAEKGTPGLILLAIIFLSIWAPVAIVVWKFFDLARSADHLLAIPVAGLVTLVVVAAFAVFYVLLAHRLTTTILSMMLPTIKAESEAAALLAQTFGGDPLATPGFPASVAIDPHTATVRTKQVMRALVDRGRAILGYDRVRCNIFTLHGDHKLRILDDFHVNLKGATAGDVELTIAIPRGYLSSGRAYEYSRPVLSRKSSGAGVWPYAYDLESDAALLGEVEKAHPDLGWIVSMPILYQVTPFKLVAGVLNVDGLEGHPTTKDLQALLADQSTAAALIGVLNRNVRFLEGEYQKPSEPRDPDKEQLREHLLEPEVFDPASCPEPSGEFVQALANIPGLEFFRRVSPADVASYLRRQLCA